VTLHHRVEFPEQNRTDDDQSLPLMNIFVAGRTKRDKKPRIEGYVENVLPHYNIDDFRSVLKN